MEKQAMTEPAEEQPDPRTIPRMSSFVPVPVATWPGTPDTGAPWLDTLSPVRTTRAADNQAKTKKPHAH
jgi:hypothetical protein